MSNTMNCKCPVCGADMVEKDKLFQCSTAESNYNEETKEYDNSGCEYKIFKDCMSRFGKYSLSAEEVEKAINDGHIEVELISKAGKPYIKNAIVDKKWGLSIDFNSHNDKK